MVNDGDHLLLVLRKDLVENPQASAEYKAKFGKDLGCPDTVAEWVQQAAFFQTKEGETRWGIKFEKACPAASATARSTSPTGTSRST